MPRVAILQSNYIPWKGYFDLINSVDVFVLYDDVQYTRRDWRNRNKIKTKDGSKWLTIPVNTKGNFGQNICQTTIQNREWCQKHLQSIKHNYAKTPFFNRYFPELEKLYNEAEKQEYLSAINKLFIEWICFQLSIQTKIIPSSQFKLSEGRSEKLLSICKELSATTYVSGPAAQAYLDETLFKENSINVEWYDYGTYKEYRQEYPPFDHAVTIMDLILNEGPEAKSFMNSFDKTAVID